ncbi:hypothetical protein PCANC_02645 [Puccinia coronata f. sp. avenae]|uniref:Uncharacterized protein n=1 Tax=Puccinia coronata f. sp. avenae TaxID=200324 RepID=A0A2N5W5J1_9BASI|nr:hypothetical protein PCANC_02645 [Puccinia coronata f. sp. avenae]
MSQGQGSNPAPRIRILPIHSRTRQIPGPAAEGLKASVEANLNAKNSLQMVSKALLDPLELSGRIPDFQKAVPHPDPIRGLVGCCEFCGVRIGTLVKGDLGDPLHPRWKSIKFLHPT